MKPNMKKPSNNKAYIDAQNLHVGTTKSKQIWQVDLKRFRVYLREKYNVGAAYIFFGFARADQSNLYRFLQEAGYVVIFREHNEVMSSKKKGNVDTDIVFAVMEDLYKNRIKGRVVLVSGDGDYFRLVRFLVEEDKMEKVLFPNEKRASSLYKLIEPKYYTGLDRAEIKRKIGFKENKK
jgi:uncharacterized LabA/DUF88 family protein